MAAAVPVLGAFAPWERHKKAADGAPLVDPALFRQRPFSTGTLLAAAGMLGVIWTVDRYGGNTQSWQLILALAVCGLGLGSMIAPLVNIVLAGIRRQDAAPPPGCPAPPSRSAAPSGWR
jgi:hypothetical protein